jgi:hypothetical protein
VTRRDGVAMSAGGEVSLGMAIRVRIPDTCRVPDPTGMDTWMIFYPRMVSVPNPNRDG